MSIQVCRDARCNGTLSLPDPRVPQVFSNTNKCDAHLFCSSRSLSTLVSDAKKHDVDRVVARSINAVSYPSFYTPLLVFNTLYLRRAQWAREEAQIAEIEAAVLKGRLRVIKIHSGSFSTQTARSLECVRQTVRL